MGNGFVSLSKYQLHGTIAAGDGIVFRMIMPTNEEVEGDITAYFTCKGYYSHGLQVLFYGSAYKSKAMDIVKLFLPSFLIYSIKLTKIVLNLYLHLSIAQLQRFPLLQGHHCGQFLIASCGVPCTSYVRYPRTSYVAPAPP
jgi:hypothetical protein